MCSLVPSYRRAVDMYNDHIKESNVDSQMGGDNDEDWCAPSVTQTFDDEDEEVLVEKEDSVDTDPENKDNVDAAKSVFRADVGLDAGGKGCM